MSNSSYSFRPGFRGFRKPEAISTDALDALKLRFEGDDRYVLYTGGAYSRRRASLRSNALATITEIGKPISVLEFLTRSAKAAGEGVGYDPSTALGGLALHQGAKPAVYLYLARKGDDFFAIKDIPTPGGEGYSKAIKAGDKVFSIAAPIVAAEAVEEPKKGKRASK